MARLRLHRRGVTGIEVPAILQARVLQFRRHDRETFGHERKMPFAATPNVSQVFPFSVGGTINGPTREKELLNKGGDMVRRLSKLAMI